MRCPDCKGTGEYIGVRVVEDCQRCKGEGEVNADDASINRKAKTKEIFTLIPSEPLDPCAIRQKKMDERAKRVYDKFDKDTDWIQIVRKPKIGMDSGSPKLNIGDIIHIYDAGWHEAKVISFFFDHGEEMVCADTPCDRFRIRTNRLTYNLTQQRWEHIKAGTPVWP